MQRWGSQEGSGPSAVTFHTKVLSHAGLGERRSFGETREVVRGELCRRQRVMWTEMQAGLPVLQASSVSRDHTAGKRCVSCQNPLGASLVWSGAAFNLKPLHSVFAMATCVQPFASTLSLASSDVTHCWCGHPWAVSVPCHPHWSCSALLAWCCRAVPGGTCVLPSVLSRLTPSIASGSG